MMARSRRWFLVFAALAAAITVGAVWFAPAALFDVELARMTGGRLRLDRAEGTVWQGHGVLTAGTARIPIAWRLDAGPLLRGDVHVHVLPDAGAGTGSPRADIAIIGEHVVVRDAEITVPASLFVAASGTTAVWGAGGDVSISATALDWAPPVNRGAAQIRWRDARLFLPVGMPFVDLGDIAMTVTADGDRLSGPVSNDGGDLAVRGEFALRANDAVHASLLLAPRRADTPLTQVLAAIGTADGTGWRVDWRLPLR